MEFKRIKLDSVYPTPSKFLIDCKILPSEIWSIIFSYLDKKSLHSVSATSKLWFYVVRRDPSLSSCVKLENMNVLEFHKKVENSEWIWSRWPVLKSLEFGNSCLFISKPITAQKVTDLHEISDFKQYSCLEKVISNVSCYIIELFPNVPKKEYPNNLPIYVKRLSFNPRIDIECFGIEHTLDINLELDTNLSTGIHQPEEKSKVQSQLELIADSACELTNLSIYISKNYFKLEGIQEILTNSFSYLFLKLKSTLQVVHLTLPSLSQIDFILRDCKTAVNLFVEHVTLRELRKFDFSLMCQQLKYLRKCYIYVIVENAVWNYCLLRKGEMLIDLCTNHDLMHQWKIKTKNYIDLTTKCKSCKMLQKCYAKLTEESKSEWNFYLDTISFQWLQILYDVFQDISDVNIDFVKWNRDTITGLTITKVPFQKSFSKDFVTYKVLSSVNERSIGVKKSKKTSSSRISTKLKN